ncbi:uncharacterized protein [Palaemon carinicauda]|uniref:uncharacterized protein n=1 Tax=Palaemon carinicauda TaxID=392227 RepID=UPI0035B5F70D
MSSSSNQIRINCFNPSKISLELWLSLLETHFGHLNVTEADKKKNVLLVSLGTEVFSVLGNLCAPDLPHTKSYDDLAQLLEGSSFGNQFDSRITDQLFMAVDAEVYFSNLVALNINLQAMTSQAILERILNMGKAFVSEKEEVQSQVQVVRRKYEGLSCQGCGFSHDSFYCRFKHLSCNNCHKKGHLQKVCKEAKRESGYGTAKGSNKTNSSNTNLCGKNLMKHVGIYLARLDESAMVNNVLNVSVEQVFEDYNVDVGKPISRIVAKIHLKNDAILKFVKACTVPFYHKEMVEVAIDKLVSENIKESVSHSEWDAPIVPLLKENKKEIRICADFKHLNKQIQCDKCPLPKIDELLCSVGKGKIFTKIDLKNAYLQIPVEEQSQEFLVI